MPHLDEVKADSSGEIILLEELSKLPGPTESGIADPEVFEFEYTVEGVGSPRTVAKPVGNESITFEKETSSNSSQSPPSDKVVVESTLSVQAKGRGLRKWRRIKRDVNKDGSSSADSAQILKRRFNNTEPSKSHEESKMKSKAEAEGEDSVASVESRNVEANPHLVGTGTLDPELERLASSGFSIGMDSDNSEDHSSKSSTAASAPRQKHESLKLGKERGRVKNFSGMGSTLLLPLKIQKGSGGIVDSSNKMRDDLARFEKENSLSSVESDLRSSVAGIVQRGSVVNSNGRSLKFDEHSDEAHTGEEVRSGYYKDNIKAKNSFKDNLDGKLLEENDPRSENCQSSSSIDPFMESMAYLQEAQEVLEKEIQKIGVIGKEQDNNILFEGMEAGSSQTLEAHLTDLKKKVEILESKLEEASTTIKAKEQKLCELEAVLGSTHSPKIEHMSTNISSIQQREEEATSDLEVLLKEKMEAEIEYFILTRTTQNWKILSDEHTALFKEQMHLACDQEQMMLKLREAEEKTIKLSEQTQKLEEYCKELVGMENVLRLQNKACMFSLCFIVQLMLLFIALGLFLVHLLSPADGVAPT